MSTEVPASERLKGEVRSHWEDETCGTRYSGATDPGQYFAELSRARYELEPYIPELANFPSAQGKRVLEIGVGAGSDFERWCPYAEHVTGIDLTDKAIATTRERLQLAGVPPSKYTLERMDCERLAFADASFDIVYSYGVLHHSPNTEQAFREVLRVLKPGGVFRGMIYHLYSWTTLLLYVRHGVLGGQFRQTPREIVFDHLESPGTKVYSVREANALLTRVGFHHVHAWTMLGPGDLLSLKLSKKHDSALSRAVLKLYPRRLVRLLGDGLGLGLMLTATKAGAG